MQDLRKQSELDLVQELQNNNPHSIKLLAKCTLHNDDN